MTQCPFCNLENLHILAANPHALALSDNFPLTSGHTLIIPKRHIASFFELTQEEQGGGGDQPDPRGGVRWVFPDKAAYWEP